MTMNPLLMLQPLVNQNPLHKKGTVIHLYVGKLRIGLLVPSDLANLIQLDRPLPDPLILSEKPMMILLPLCVLLLVNVYLQEGVILLQ